MPRSPRSFDRRWGSTEFQDNPWEDLPKGKKLDPTGLKTLRVQKKLSMHLLAKKLGIRVTLLDKIERGTTSLEVALTPEQLSRLWEILTPVED
jgi:DNA-binding transcriptional regulator YiaG